MGYNNINEQETEPEYWRHVLDMRQSERPHFKEEDEVTDEEDEIGDENDNIDHRIHVANVSKPSAAGFTKLQQPDHQ